MKNYVYMIALASLAFSPLPVLADGDVPYESENKYLPSSTVEDTPLVVIRFSDKENVMYQVPLYNAVKKAIHVYPGAFFEVVSYIPTTGDYQQDEAAALKAATNAKKLMLSMHEIGLPKERYQTRYTTISNANFNEVRIFVR